MKQENTKQKILDKALYLFSLKGFDSTSMDEIAKEVGIKASSIYNHFSNKQAILESLICSISDQYTKDTQKINIHVQKPNDDLSYFENIDEEKLFEKVKQMFKYSIHNEKIFLFRKMMTIEQFRSNEYGELYTQRYVHRIVDYHAQIFKNLIDKNEIRYFDPKSLAMLYVSPILVLIGIVDRNKNTENECLKKLREHINTFYSLIHK